MSEATIRPSDDHRLLLTLAIIAGFQLLLMATTHPLWTGSDPLPQIPLLRLFGRIPATGQLLLAFVQIAGLMFVCFTAFDRLRITTDRTPTAHGVRSAAVVIVSCGLLLAACSQQRLQPWYWLSLQCFTFTVLFPSSAAIRLMRLNVACAYLFSAVSRISPDIAHSMTGEIAKTLMQLLNLKFAAADPLWISRAAWTCVAGEFLTGILLLLPATRRTGIGCSILLHAMLIIALSPVGLDHHGGVLIWNAMFLLLVPPLFVADSEVRFEAPLTGRIRLPFRLMSVVLVLLPLSGLFGWFDNWPSWQLYSPRPEVLKVFVRDRAAGELPTDVQPFVGELMPFDDWRPVRIDRWSLAATGAPLYPEDRFQLGVIESLARGLQNDMDVKVTVDAPQPLQFWRRVVRQINGREELRAATETDDPEFDGNVISLQEQGA